METTTLMRQTPLHSEAMRSETPECLSQCDPLSSDPPSQKRPRHNLRQVLDSNFTHNPVRRSSSHSSYLQAQECITKHECKMDSNTHFSVPVNSMGFKLLFYWLINSLKDTRALCWCTPSFIERGFFWFSFVLNWVLKAFWKQPHVSSKPLDQLHIFLNMTPNSYIIRIKD